MSGHGVHFLNTVQSTFLARKRPKDAVEREPLNMSFRCQFKKDTSMALN